MGTQFGFAFVRLAAVKTDAAGGRGGGLAEVFRPFRFIADHQINGQEDDQEKENEDGPQEAAAEAESVFLGIEKHPEGDNETEGREEKNQDRPRKERSAIS